MAGMDDYIAKPIKPAELHAVIDRVLGILMVRQVGSANSGACIDVGGCSDCRCRCHTGSAGWGRGRFSATHRLFFSDLERNRKSLELAQRTSDFATIRSLAHTIKGSAGVFNAAGAMAAAQRLENAGKAQDGAAVRRSCRICSPSWASSRVVATGEGARVDFVSALSVFLQPDLPEIPSRAIIRKVSSAGWPSG
jgi:protein-histidine pros-kinase